jgi:hypothetical protein
VEASENVLNIRAEVIIDESSKPLFVDDLEKVFAVVSELRSGEISN